MLESLTLTDLFGGLGTLAAFVMWLPQGLRTWQKRHDTEALLGLSLATPILILANSLVWIVYGVFAGSFWAGAPAIVIAPVTALSAALIHRAHSKLTGDSNLSIPSITTVLAVVIPCMMYMLSPTLGEHTAGVIGSLLSTGLLIPQALRTFALTDKPDMLAGVSVQTQVLLIINAASWIIYGLLGGAFWISVPCYLNLPIAAFVLVLVLRARSRRAAAQKELITP